MMLKSKSHAGWGFVFCVVVLLIKGFNAQDAKEHWSSNLEEDETSLDKNFENTIATTESIIPVNINDIKDQIEDILTYDNEFNDHIIDVIQPTDLPSLEGALFTEGNEYTTIIPDEEFIANIDEGIKNQEDVMEIYFEEETDHKIPLNETASNATLEIFPENEHLDKPLADHDKPKDVKNFDETVLMQRFGLADVSNTASPFELSGKINSPTERTVLPINVEEFSRATPEEWKPVWPFPDMQSISIKPTVRFPSISFPITRLVPTTIIPSSQQYTIPKEPITAYYFDIPSIAPIPPQGPLHDPAHLSPSLPRFKEEGSNFEQDSSHLESSIDDNVRSPNINLPIVVEATPVFLLPTALRTTPTRTFQDFERTSVSNSKGQPLATPIENFDDLYPDLSSIYDWTSPRIKNTTVTYSLGNSSDFQFDKNVSKTFEQITNSTNESTLPPSTLLHDIEEPFLSTGDQTEPSQSSINASLPPKIPETSHVTYKSITNTPSSVSRIPLWQRISNKISTQSSVTASSFESSSQSTPILNSFSFENDIPIGIFSPKIIKVPFQINQDNINNIDSPTSLADKKLSSPVPFVESSLLSTTTNPNIKSITNIYGNGTTISNNLEDGLTDTISHDSVDSLSDLLIKTNDIINNKKIASKHTPTFVASHSVDIDRNEVIPTLPSINLRTRVPQRSSNVNISSAQVESAIPNVAPQTVNYSSDNSSVDSTAGLGLIPLTEEDALNIHTDFIFGVTVPPTPLLPYDEVKYSNYNFGERSSSSKPVTYDFFPFPNLKSSPPKFETSTINSKTNEVYETSDEHQSFGEENKIFENNFSKNFSHGNNEKLKPEDEAKPSSTTDTDVPYSVDDTALENKSIVDVLQLSTPKEPRLPNWTSTEESSTSSSSPSPSTTTSMTPRVKTSSSSSVPEFHTTVRTTKIETTTEKTRPITTDIQRNITTTEKPTEIVEEVVIAIIEDNAGFEPGLHIVKMHPNGTNTTHPSPFVKAAVSYDIRQFCQHKNNIHALLKEWINVHATNKSNSMLYEIEVFNQPDCKNVYLVEDEPDETIENRTDLYFYVKQNGTINPNVTIHFPRNPTNLEISAELEYLKRKILHLELVNASPFDDNLFIEKTVMGTSFIAIAVIASVLLVLLLCSVIAFFVIKRRKAAESLHGRRCTPANDAYSLDSVSMFYHSLRRKSRKRASNKSLKSYLNQGFDDPNGPSYPLTFAKLTHHISDNEGIHNEFSKIPATSVKYEEMPRGVEDKNRFANVIPVSETRILLNNTTPYSEYINANSIHGPKGELRYYIATQAPLEETVADFWQMIWEQETKVIVMLTDFVEKGIDKCADYLPPSETLDCHRVYAEFQITLKSRDLRDKYVVSVVQIKNLENNLIREIAHMWFTGWPHSGVPNEEKNFISFIFDVRMTRKQLRAKGPILVHCSPGTGRTGTYIACDLAMRQFDDLKVVDIPKTVYRIRRERAGAVQTRDQYAFIYRVVNLYAAKLTTGNLDSF